MRNELTLDLGEIYFLLGEAGVDSFLHGTLSLLSRARIFLELVNLYNCTAKYFCCSAVNIFYNFTLLQ